MSITLILPDIHLKWFAAQQIIDEVPHDRCVLLGDYFDDFGDTPEDNQRAAEWVKEKLADPAMTLLLGNHDTSYWSPERYACSGFTRRKHDAIHEVLKDEDWRKLTLRTWVDGWLCTHAGVDRELWNEDPTLSEVEHFIDAAEKSIFAPWESPHKIHPGLAAGWDRGGPNRVGGLTWAHFSGLHPIPGFNQICGHTPDRRVRKLELKNGDIVVCADSHLHHFLVIEDGELSIHDTPASVRL